MDTEGTTRPGLAQVRDFHLSRLNDALRRPGVWGGETTLRLFLDTVAFVDGLADAWQREQDLLRTRDAFPAQGVRGALANVLPGYDDDGAVASVYAEIARRHGWLTVDRVILEEDHRRLRADIADWCGHDRNLDEVLAEFGAPSVRCGSGNPRYNKTLTYATADNSVGLVSLHFAGTYDWNAPQPQPQPQPVTAPVLLAVRHGDGRFCDTFTFTPAGAAFRRHHGTAPQPSPVTTI